MTKTTMAMTVLALFSAAASATSPGWAVTDHWDAINSVVDANKTVNDHTEALKNHNHRIDEALNVGAVGQQMASDAIINNHRQDQTLDKHGSLIQSNSANIAAQNKLIADQGQQLADHNHRLNALDRRVDDFNRDMKRGLAAQAALTGLFQPYNVGKFNVTAALGGYKSEQAMAVGTGYRLNHNFAVKGGVASDLGKFDSLSYHVGMNYEF